MSKTNSENQGSCHCSHCLRFGVKVIGGNLNGGEISKNADSYLMRGVFRDVTLEKHPSRLSVRWVNSGRYTYEIDGRKYVLQPGNFLIIADGEIYNSATDQNAISECLSVSFNSRILENVLDVLNKSEDFLLDNPFEQAAKLETEFFTAVYKPNAEMKNLLEIFSERAVKSAKLYQTSLDQAFYGLMEPLVLLQKQVVGEIRGIPAGKSATREELYRRLSRARDFIRANAFDDLKIETIASVACLSPYHFLRSYKAAFGITPHQELLEVRLERAVMLIVSQKNNFTLGRIAFESGFADLSSFSKAFRQKFKTPPSKFKHPENSALYISGK